MGRHKSLKPNEPKDSWKTMFRTEVVDHKNVHYCKSCEYNTTIQKDMQYHVRKHLKKSFPFACTEANCDKAFKKQDELNEHLIHHKCGFGIEGMEEIGICGATALKAHYEMVVIDNKFKYVCREKTCDYVITHVTAIEKHVHNIHVCPYLKDYGL